VVREREKNGKKGKKKIPGDFAHKAGRGGVAMIHQQIGVGTNDSHAEKGRVIASRTSGREFSGVT